MPTEHRNPDGTFRNPWPDSAPHDWRDLLQWARERRKQSRVPTPARDSFPVATPVVSYPHAAPAVRCATWVGHSTVLLQAAGMNILTDPVWSARASPVSWLGPRRVMSPALQLEALPPLDVILVSHSHYDHLDGDTVRRLARAHPAARWIVPLGLARVIRRWGASEIIELDWWDRTEVVGVSVTATPARHFSARGLGDRNRTLWCGYALEFENGRAFFAGDTAYHADFGAIGARCGPFDLVMLPIGSYDPRWFMHVVHMDPEEAIRAYEHVAAAHPNTARPLMLAIHWGTFRLTDEPMDEPPRRARTAFQAHGLDDQKLWIARFGETRAW